MGTKVQGRRRAGRVRIRRQLQKAIRDHVDSQTKIAVECGLDPATLSRIVNGLKVPDDRTRQAIARHLRRPERELFPRG